MTISEKSTELGIDLAQIALDANKIMKCSNDGVFQCFCAGGTAQNIYIMDDNSVQIHDGYFRYENDVLGENSTLETVETDFKSYISGMEFVAMPIKDILTELT